MASKMTVGSTIVFIVKIYGSYYSIKLVFQIWFMKLTLHKTKYVGTNLNLPSKIILLINDIVKRKI